MTILTVAHVPQLNVIVRATNIMVNATFQNKLKSLDFQRNGKAKGPIVSSKTMTVHHFKYHDWEFFVFVVIPVQIKDDNFQGHVF